MGSRPRGGGACAGSAAAASNSHHHQVGKTDTSYTHTRYIKVKKMPLFARRSREPTTSTTMVTLYNTASSSSKTAAAAPVSTQNKLLLRWWKANKAFSDGENVQTHASTCIVFEHVRFCMEALLQLAKMAERLIDLGGIYVQCTTVRHTYLFNFMCTMSKDLFQLLDADKAIWVGQILCTVQQWMCLAIDTNTLYSYCRVVQCTLHLYFSMLVTFRNTVYSMQVT